MKSTAIVVAPAITQAEIPSNQGRARRGFGYGPAWPSLAEATGKRFRGENEVQMQGLVEAALRDRGEEFRTQVVCAAGRADIVTASSVIEVKCRLYRPDLLAAIGQVLMYRRCIDTRLDAVVAGVKCPGLDALYDHARALGVDLWLWEYK